VKKVKLGNRRYGKALKRKIAEEYLSGKFSYAVAAEEYGLKDKEVVKEFVRWYKRALYLEQMEEKDHKESSQEESPASTESPTQEQVHDLKQQLEQAKLKIAGLESLIDLAEQELKIAIRKKSGTKQSNK
jgi:transposase